MNALVLAALVAAQAIGSGSVGGGGSGAAADPTPVFDFSPNLGSGPQRLSAADAFGSTVAILCDNRTDTGTTFPCGTGGTFTENPTGVTNNAPSPWTEQASRASAYRAGVAHQAPNTTLGDVTTGAFYLLVVARLEARASAQQVAGKWNNAGATGYKIGVDASDQLNATVNGTTITSSWTIDAVGEWNILALYCDPGVANGMRLYQNGYTIGTPTTCPSGTKTNGNSFTIGARSDGAGADFINGHVAYTILRTVASGGFTSTAAMDAQAQKDAQQLMGVWPERAVTAAPLSTDLRATRASIEIDRDSDGVIRIHRVGQKWLRVGRIRPTARGNIRATGQYSIGYVSEEGIVTKLDRTVEFDNAAWSQLNVADNIQTERYYAPDGSDDGDRLRGAVDGVGTEHGVYNTSSTLTTEKWTFSVFSLHDTGSSTVKQYIWLRDNTIGATAIAWFDTFACTVSQHGAGLYAQLDPPMVGETSKRHSAYARYYGTVSGVIACRLEIDILGTVATHRFDIGVSDSPGVTTSTVAGANDALAGLWGAQLEQGEVGDRATSFAWTFGSEVDRDFDGLRFAIANAPTEGMMTWGIRLNESRLGVNLNTSYICTPYLDESNYMLVKPTQNVALDGLRGVAQTQGDGAGVVMDIDNGNVQQVDCCGNAPPAMTYNPAISNMYDGDHHHVRAIYKTDDFRVYLDGDSESGITDTGGTPPTLTGGSLLIGYESNQPDRNHPEGVIEWCRFFTAIWEPTYP